MSDEERRIGDLAVCGLRTPQGDDGESTLVCHVDTPDIGREATYDHRFGAELSLEQVKGGSATEKINMQKCRLYDRVPMSHDMSKKVLSMWVDESRLQDVWKLTVRSRCTAMEFSVHDRLDTYDVTPPLKSVQLIILRATTRLKHGAMDWTRVLGLHDIVTAFWRADLPSDEPICIMPPCSEKHDGTAWELRQAMPGARCASYWTLAQVRRRATASVTSGPVQQAVRLIGHAARQRQPR